MNEYAKTGICAAVAVALGAIAWATAPKAPTSEVFKEQGQLFFPDFTDSSAATSLQVVEYDAAESAPSIFKVELKNGRWTIPSHHDYPADGKERLARTATFVMGIRKEKIRSERAEDHAACGVIDPEDPVACDAKDRGKRVTIRNAGGSVLADFIIGRKTGGGDNRWFVRVPDQKRVYDVKMDVDLSTKFGDWIETDLTKLDPGSVWKVTLQNYSVKQDGSRFSLENKEITDLEKAGETWTMPGLAADEEVDPAKMGTITHTVHDLKILGVRKKTAAMIAWVKGEEAHVEQADVMDMVEKGFIPISGGQLLSKEGNLVVICDDGVIYQLRFGAVFTGSGIDLTGGEGKKDEKKDPKKDDKKPSATEARFLMILVDFDDKSIKPEKLEDAPKSPTRVEMNRWEKVDRRKQYENAMKAWQARVAASQAHFAEKKAAGEKRAKQLQDRFADWFYVIGADSFTSLRLSRKDLVKSKNKPAEPPPPGDGPFPPPK